MPVIAPGHRVLVVRPGRHGYGADARTAFATITTIGRRWAQLDTGERFDVATRRLDGSDAGYGAGRVYADAAAWEREQQTAAAWTEFSRRVRDTYTVPAGLEMAQIAAAAAALGWTLAAADAPVRAPRDPAAPSA